MSKYLQDKIDALESKVAYQDITIETLDEQVKKLNSLVETVQLYCKKIEQRINELDREGGVLEISEQVPPHY